MAPKMTLKLSTTTSFSMDKTKNGTNNDDQTHHNNIIFMVKTRNGTKNNDQTHHNNIIFYGQNNKWHQE